MLKNGTQKIIASERADIFVPKGDVFMKIGTIINILKYKMKGSFQVAKEAGMIVEENVSVMGGVNFGSEPYLITLKKNCLISADVLFLTHDGGTNAFIQKYEEFKDVKKFGKIVVGEESFIGARSIIMPGIKIGNNCVVGAGSVVTHDIPDVIVVCGIPAKPVCSTYEYALRCKAKMPEGFDIEKYNANKKEYLKEIY